MSAEEYTFYFRYIIFEFVFMKVIIMGSGLQTIM